MEWCGNYNSKGGGFYESSDRVVWLKAVNRDYSQIKKRPVMYLNVKDKTKSKDFRYLTGLFTTKNKNILSGDIKNEWGIKQYIQVIVNGSSIEIKQV